MISKETPPPTKEIPLISKGFLDHVLDERSLCDLEMILNGGFSPLKGFMNQEDYQSVLNTMRLKDGSLWPIPIVLHVPNEKIELIESNNITGIILRDKYFTPIAKLEIKDIYQPNLQLESKAIFGVVDENHPYIKYMVTSKSNCHYVGGKIVKINDPIHYNFINLRLTPAECKDFFKSNGWNTIVGFQTRNPMHRSHFELTKYALRQTNDNSAKLLIHPVVGVTQECDVPYETRVKCYQKIIEHYPPNTAKLSLLPLSMRMAGPREALWHALIRQNYGCTHFVVGRDHAGPSFKTQSGENFFGPYDAQKLLHEHQAELSIQIITSEWIVYVKEREEYMLINEIPDNLTKMFISGTEQRKLLELGKDIPDWFTYPNIVEELKKIFPPKIKRGFCIYFIGLSGCGKTTLANVLIERLKETLDGRKITLLDGDVIRTNLSKGLGFSKENRSVNVRRVGYVASEIVKHGGVAICATIAPYECDRQANREKIGVDNYIEVFIDTPLDVCEERDVKGLYKKARDGTIKQFTGISDPFETPINCNITVSGSSIKNIFLNIDQIVKYLTDNNFM